MIDAISSFPACEKTAIRIDPFSNSANPQVVSQNVDPLFSCYIPSVFNFRLLASATFDGTKTSLIHLPL